MSKEYNLKNILSTGNNFTNAFWGGLSGAADAVNPRGQYYVKANYKGNGLADTGIGYMANPDYRNFGDAAQMLSALFKKNKGDGSSNSILQKLQALVNTKQSGSSPYTLQGDLKNPPYSGYGEYKLPYQTYQMPSTSFNYNGINGDYKLNTIGYEVPDWLRGR